MGVIIRTFSSNTTYYLFLYFVPRKDKYESMCYTPLQCGLGDVCIQVAHQAGA